MSFYAWKSVTGTKHLVTFNGRRPCGSTNKTNLIYHVVLQDQVTKGSCYLMEGSSLLYITTLQSLVAIVIVVMEIKHI